MLRFLFPCFTFAPRCCSCPLTTSMLLTLISLLLCAAITVHAGPDSVPNTFDEEDRSIYWESCNGSLMYTNSWASIHKCFSMGHFQPLYASPVANVSQYCQTTFAISSYPNGSLSCTGAAKAMVDAYWCALGAGLTSNASAALFSSGVIPSISSSNCLDGASGFELVAAAQILLTSAPKDISVSAWCDPDQRKTKLQMCDASLDVLSSLFSVYHYDRCSNGLNLYCTACQPYLEKEAVAQPYYFVIFPALKLVFITLLKLFVFDKLNDKIRERVSLHMATNPPPDKAFSAEFTRYIMKHLLSGNHFRIRARDTLRTLNGIRYIKKLQKLHKAGEEPTKEQITMFLDPKDGIRLQAAVLPRIKGMTNFLNTMSKQGQWVTGEGAAGRLTARETSRLAAALRDEEDWYWEAVCHHGRQWFAGGKYELEEYWADVWQLHKLPSMDFHQKHESRDTSDDVNVFFREIGHEDNLRKMQYYVECELGDTLEKVHEAMLSLLHENCPDTQATLNNTHLRFYTQSGTKIATDPASLMHQTVQTLKDMDETLCFRFVFSKVNVTVSPTSYRSIASLIKDKRDAFVKKIELETQATKYDEATLIAETEHSLAEVLDDRLATTVAQTMLVMAGEEVMSECDATVQRYIIRDSIPEVQPILLDEEKALKEKRSGHSHKKKTHKMVKRNKGTTTNNTTSSSSNGGSHEPIDVPPSQKPKAVPLTPKNATMLIAPHLSEQLNQFDELDISQKNVRMLYNEVYDSITMYTNFKGEKVPGALKCYERDLPAVKELLSELWENICDALVEANDDPFAVDLTPFIETYTDRLQDLATIIQLQPTEQMIFFTLYNINVYVLLFQIVFGVIFFSIAASDADESLPHGSGFDRYQLLYFRFMNSGTPVSLLFAAVANMFSGEQNRATSYFYKIADFAAIAMSVLLISAPLCTHIIPAFVMFIWVLLIVALIFIIPSLLTYLLYRRLDTKWSDDSKYTPEEMRHSEFVLKRILTVWFLWNQFAFMILFTGIFQTSFNWGLLYYRHDSEELTYTSVISYELFARTSRCYFAQIWEENSNIFQFFSSFVG